MYVFDRGYLDYERFDRMTNDGFFFVSRLRKNAVTRLIESFDVPEQSSVLSDKMILINQVYIAMIVYCLNVLAQLHTNSSRTYLQMSKYLKATLWKPARIWLRKIEGNTVHKDLELSVASVKGYSKSSQI